MATITQTLRWGSKGSQVETLQKILNQRVPTAKLPNGKKLVVDGIFGSKTYQAVKAFQRLNKRIDNKTALKVDGIVGKNTRAVLNKTRISSLPKNNQLKSKQHINNILSTKKNIEKAQEKLDQLIKQVNIDIRQEEIRHMRCLKLRRDAEVRIKEVLLYDRLSKISYSIGEAAIITALSGGLGIMLRGGYVATALANYRVAFFVCSQVGSNITAGIVTSVGVSAIKSFLSGKFTVDDFINLSKDISITKLAAHLGEKSQNKIAILGVVYAAGMAYLDCKLKEQDYIIQRQLNSKIHRNQAKKHLGYFSRLVGLDKYYYEELQMYYKYKSETIIRWEKYNYAIRSRENLKNIKNSKQRVKNFIENGFKAK